MKSKILISLIILAILSTISILVYISYNAYITRTKVSEAFTLVEPAQREIEKYADTHHGLPLNAEVGNSDFGLPNPFTLTGSYISDIVVHKPLNVEEVIVYARVDTNALSGLQDNRGNILQQPYIRFIGIYNNNDLNWHCVSNIAKKYLPDSCISVVE